MTIIGVYVERDHAMCWADTESYTIDKVTKRTVAAGPHQLKLAFNEAACIAAAGAGTIAGNRHIAEAVDFAQSFDEFCFGLPRLLNGWAEDWFDGGRGEWPNWICAAVGYSHRLRCMMGATFEATDKFAVKLGKSFLAPRVAAQADLANFFGPADLVPVAQKQMAVIKEFNPFAGAGTLTIAELRRGAVTTTAFDIPSGMPLAALPDLPKMRAGYLPQVCDASCVGGGKQRADGGGGSAVGANS